MTAYEQANKLACVLRVLVVDNDPETRNNQIELLTHWGYIPVVAQGVGDALLEDAIHKAKAHRCQIALVDMRLRDNYDLADRSGLELVPELQPTTAIILSSFDDRKAAVAALKEHGAADFVGREDGPEQLQARIEAVAKSISACKHKAEIIWVDNLTSMEICGLLFRNWQDIPEDQIDQAIGQMFPGAGRITLTLIGDAIEPSNRVSALRRSSRVFRVVVDHQPALRVVKLARVDKIENELQNYEHYVRYGMPGQFRPEKFAEALLWDLGAVAYSYVNNPGLGVSGGPQTFKEYYRTTDSVEQILTPLRHFFADANWGSWYKKEVTSLVGSLVDAYDTIWNGHLKSEFESWRKQETPYYIGLSFMLPNPMRWLVEHYRAVDDVQNLRKAVTHGDLHGDNIFVNSNYAWPIDFERTGPGPIMRDFVELIQDIVTRIARFDPPDFLVLYEFAVALCEPSATNQQMRLTHAIQQHAEAHKAFQVVQELQNLAYKLAGYEDRREYLWGLLLNNLFVATLLPKEEIRRTRTLLFASVICGRLGRWKRPDWPPRDWQEVKWVAE